MKKNYYIVFIFLLFCVVHIQAQLYNFKNYTVNDGLIQANVYSLSQDRNGHIWVGTQTGICVYNGYDFFQFNDTLNFPNNIVFALHYDKNKAMWIGGSNGLYKQEYISQKCVEYPIFDNSEKDKTVYTIAEFDKKIWVGTKNGLKYIENDSVYTFMHHPVLSKQIVFSIQKQNDSILWIGTFGFGLFKYNKNTDSITIYNQANGLNDNNIRTILCMPNEDVFIGSNKGLNQIKADTILSFFNTDTMRISITSSMIKDGNIWFGSYNGVIKMLNYNNNNMYFKHYTKRNGLSNLNVWSIYVDNEDVLWIGTVGGGVYKLVDDNFVTYNEQNGLSNSNVLSVYNTNSQLWIGYSESCDMVDYQSLKKIRIDVNNYLKSATHIYSFAKDIEQNMLLAGIKNAICTKTEGEKDFEKLINLPNVNVYDVFYDKQENAYLIGTNIGLVHYDQKIGKHQVLIDESKLNSYKKLIIVSIYKDKLNQYWYCTNQGLIRQNGLRGSIEIFNKKDNFTDKWVSSVVQDSAGNFWFATDEGLFYYNDKEFLQFTVKNSPISSNNVFLEIIDNQNFLWIGTNKGLDRIDLRYFYKVQKLRLKHFGKNEGFLGVECNMNAVDKNKLGQLFFGTINGLTIINPQKIKQNKIPPTIVLNKIELFYKSFNYTDYSDSVNSVSALPVNLKMPYNKNTLTFKYYAVSTINSDKIRYRYKLEGLDANWTPENSKQEAVYTNLSPGQYTFKIEACNSDGYWCEPYMFNFEIATPLWQRWWFLLLGFIFVILILYLIFYLRTKALKHRQKELEQEVKKRTNELQKANSTLSEQNYIIEEKNRFITSGIEYAGRIQKALLTSDEDILKLIPNFIKLFMPRDIVSGDFYWISEKNERIIIAAVDCTGHGVPGAFMSVLGNSLLNEIVNEKGIIDADEILNQLREGIVDALKQKSKDTVTYDGMDMGLCSIKKDFSSMQFAGANNPMYFIRNNELTVYKADRMHIGYSTEIERFKKIEIELQKGDVFYLFSDGFSDQFGGPKGKKFMAKRFKHLLLNIYQDSPQKQQEILYQKYAEWRGGLEQVDDILILGVII